MEDVGGVIVATLFFASLAVVAVLFVLSRHKERMALIEKGMSVASLNGPKAESRASAYPLSSLKWGLLAGGVGLGLILANVLDASYGMDESVYAASMLIFGGLGLVLFYFIASKRLRTQ